MSAVIKQQNVELDSKSQNTLIQKASNIILTGEDNISYQKVLRKTRKKANRRNRNTKKSYKTTIYNKRKT